MKCLFKYKWVKLPRTLVPQGKGIMGDWVRLASRAAFRKGKSVYCGFQNDVTPGMWSGGMVGVKSILGRKKRADAQSALDRLVKLDYLTYTLDRKTKKLDYQITDWVMERSGAKCEIGAVYTTCGYGFVCVPRSITQRLADQNYQFEEADAWLDLWCHTVCNDIDNIFSSMAPSVQFGRNGAILTLETLGHRWGWEKTKVWRFFKKHSDAFALYKLPGSFGCLIFNQLYPTGKTVTLPEAEEVTRTLNEIRSMATAAHFRGKTEQERLGKAVRWYSWQLAPQSEPLPPESTEQVESCQTEEESRVAVSPPIIRAYFSLCRNCKSCIYDCVGKEYTPAYRVYMTPQGPTMPIPSNIPFVIPDMPFYDL